MFLPPRTLRRLFGTRAHTVPPDRLRGLDALCATRLAVRPILESTRQYVFLHLREVAHRHDLHVAPEVSLGAVFTVDADGSEAGAEAIRALRRKRVDFLLIDGKANAVLAVDCRPGEAPSGRPMRDPIKRRAFEKARLPFLELAGGRTIADDMARVEAMLRTRAEEPAADRRAA